MPAGDIGQQHVEKLVFPLRHQRVLVGQVPLVVKEPRRRDLAEPALRRGRNRLQLIMN